MTTLEVFIGWTIVGVVLGVWLAIKLPPPRKRWWWR